MSAPQTLREKLPLEPNKPITVRLEGWGQPQQNRAGATEYRYMLHGHQIMWVPIEAHAQIERLCAGAEPGSKVLIETPLRITKTKAGRQIIWTVEAIEDEPQYGYGRSSPSSPPATNHAPAPAPKPADPPALPPPAQQRLPAADAADPFVGTTSYYTCLCAAIKSAAAAEQFATQVNRPVAFDSQDIRAIATTLYIQMVGGQR